MATMEAVFWFVFGLLLPTVLFVLIEASGWL